MFLLKNTLLAKCYNAAPSAEQQGRRMGKVQVQPISYIKIMTRLWAVENAFHDAYIEMDGEQASKLEMKTREQNESGSPVMLK